MSSHNARYLSDIILGGQDGLVNVLGLSIGMAGATGDAGLVILSGTAAMFAESISMAAVAYTSTKAAWDCEHKQELEAGLRKSEIEKILSRLPASFSERKRSLIRSRLHPHTEREGKLGPLPKAVKVGLSTLAGSALPLLPYLLLPVQSAMLASILLAGGVLFSTGALKARWTVGDWKRSGFEMLFVGGLAALAGYVIGLLLHATV
jgi:predicted membrane protein (TIGR00267 family)